MKKIMFVDDNEDLRKTVKQILDKEGYETILAADGDDCLEKLKFLTRKPDLILLDIMMPGTPVAEVIEKIGDIKIIYLSAVRISAEDKKNLLLQKNVVDFIPKPFNTEELIKTVKKSVDE